jgi:3-phenylpropionate/trans-cinnamate dioxygenase ferredoxin reductase subunit
VKLSDGASLPADIVIAGIGVVPAVTYLLDSGLVEDGAVHVDARFRTRKEGIFAAGDIAVVPDPRTGKGRRIEHWVEAERQGQHAALSMLGSEEPYGEAPFFWTKQYDVSLKYVGHAKTFDRIAYRGSVEEGTFLAGYFQNGALLAAAGSGMAGEIIVLGKILKAGIGVAPERFEDLKTDLRGLLH